MRTRDPGTPPPARTRWMLSAAVIALGAVMLATGGPAVAEDLDAAPSVAPYAKGSVPAYTPPAPITRETRGAERTTARAAPVGVVENVRPVTIADPVYSDPDLKAVRENPYNLSRHNAIQAGGTVTPYHPDPAD